jgi:tetratricopeptide (TPR) repeat protein
MFPLALPHLPENSLAEISALAAQGASGAIIEKALQFEREAANNHGRYHPQALSWALVRAAELCSSGDCRGALPLYLSVLRRVKAAYGETHALAAASHAGMGLVYAAQGLAAESLEQYVEGLRIASLRQLRDAAGILWLRLAASDAALECRAFENAHMILSEAAPDIAARPDVQLRLGAALCGCGKYDDGVTLVSDNLSSDEIEPALRASVSEILADIELTRDEPEAAATYFESALEMRRLAGDLAGQKTLRMLFRLALVLHQSGSFDKSRARHEELIALIDAEAPQPWMVDLAVDSRSDLGELCAQSGDYEHAKGLLHAALAIAEQHGRHSLCGRVLHNLGVVLAAHGELAAAREALERARSTRESALGNGHNDVADTLHALAVLCVRLEDPAATADYAQRALQIRQTHFGAESEELAPLEALLSGESTAKPAGEAAPVESAQTITATGRSVAEASELYHKAVSMLSGSQHWEALQLLAQVLKDIEERHGSDHRDLIPILAQMAAAYDQMGFEAQARAYRERAQRLGGAESADAR